LRSFLYTHLKIRNDDDWDRIKIQALTNPRKSRQAERGERERESIKRKQQKRKAETNGPDSKGHGRTCNSGTKSDLCFHGLRRLERERERKKTKQNTQIINKPYYSFMTQICAAVHEARGPLNARQSRTHSLPLSTSITG
jgi:hypothetical protein